MDTPIHDQWQSRTKGKHILVYFVFYVHFLELVYILKDYQEKNIFCFKKDW